jgi:hypothetical protein
MRTLLTVVYVAAVLAVVAFAYRGPAYNWDMLPYMALVLGHDIPNVDSLHAATFATARAQIPESKYSVLVDSANVYRRRTSHEPGTFMSEVGLYVIKPLYLLSIRAFYKLGIPLAQATVVPSLLGYLIITLLVLVWLRAAIPDPLATLTAFALALSPFMLETVRMSTPDLLAACLLLAGIYLIIEKRLPIVGLIPLSCAVLVRIDALLFVVPVLAYLSYLRLLSVRWLIAVLAVGAVICVVTFFGRADLLGQMLLMMRSSTERITSPQERSFASLYLRGVMHGLAGLQYSSIFLVMGVACAAMFLRRRLGTGFRSDVHAVTIVAMLVHIAIRYVLYPIIEDRFIIADYILIGICAATILRAVEQRLSTN